MSGENLEVVRGWVEAFNAEDTNAFVALWDPECEFFSVTGSQLDGAPYRGPEGIRRYRAERAEMWAKLRLDPEQILATADPGVLVAVGWLRGEGRGSHVAIEQRIGLVYVLRGRRVLYCRSYPDPGDALEGVGLRQ